MIHKHALTFLYVAAALLVAAAAPSRAGQIFTNTGFELGLTDWNTAQSTGSDGGFFVQSGTASPQNGDPVPAPPGGINAAMSDGFGPGSHVLYRDFLATSQTILTATLSFDMFIGNRSQIFRTPAGGTLDFSVADFNQQVRVDIMKNASGLFSVAGSDVVSNLYQSKAGDPLVSGYNTLTFDLKGLLTAHHGETLRLRFAETDNDAPLQLGLDNVNLDVSTVPEPATIATAALGLIVAALALRRRRLAS